MLLALHAVDFGLVGLFVLTLLAVAAYHFGQPRQTVDAYLQANGTSAWIPWGLSLAAMAGPLEFMSLLAGRGYYVGLGALLAPLALVAVAFAVGCAVLPLFAHASEATSAAYFEQRFSPTVRGVQAILAGVWRAVLTVALLAGAARVMAHDSGVGGSPWVWTLALGAGGTLLAYLGGQPAVVWNGALRWGMATLAAFVFLAALAATLPGGFSDIGQQAEKFGRWQWHVRSAPLESHSHGLWRLLQWCVVLLAWQTADPAMHQHYFSLRGAWQSRAGLALQATAAALLLGLVAACGWGALAFFQRQPEELRPIWVVNVDPKTRQPLHAPSSHRPLVDWRADGPALDRATFDEHHFRLLVADGRLIDPNSREPFAVAADLLDDTGDRLRISRLALRDPRTGEFALAAPATRELLPRLAARPWPLGVAGLILLGGLALALASWESTLLALATALTREARRRFGFLGGRSSAASPRLELAFARNSVLACGAGLTLLAMIAAEIPSLNAFLHALTLSAAGVLLGLYMLALATRFTTARGAIVGLALGGLASVSLAILESLSSTVTLPSAAITLAITLAAGLAASVVLGPRKTKTELRGLVWGIGRLGQKP